MRRMVTALLTFGGLATLSFGQQSAVSSAPKDATGIVVGHVYCGDTNAPARFAKVVLEPTRDVSDFDPTLPEQKQKGNMVSLIPTRLDGSFIIPSVKPGTYFIIAEKHGYISPMYQFPQEDIKKVTSEFKQKMMKALRKVTVDANQTTSVEVRLERGAAVSGTVSYDDSSPADGVSMTVLRKGEDGKWHGLHPGAAEIRIDTETDDQGHYRMAGLPAGEYLVRAELNVNDIKTTHFLVSGGANSMWMNSRFSLPIYSGGGTREKDASSFKVEQGEERSGEDIVIPLSKFHPVTGNVVAAHDGHIVNAGKVSLLFADDKSLLASADIDKADSVFHFDFVPEGEYLLETKDARDVTREEVMYPAGTMPPSYTKETEVHAYGTADQPFSLHGETSNVLLSVPEKNAKPVTASAQ